MKTLLLIISISLGIIFPYGHSYAFLIRYFVMIMLLFAFLEIKVSKSMIRKSHFVILAANISIALLAYTFAKQFNVSAANAVLITAIAPTAVASPVIISLLNGKVEYTAFSLLLTNFVIALLLPFLLPALVDGGINISVGTILFPVISVFAIPYAAALLISKTSTSLKNLILKRKGLAFYLLVINIYMGTSKASHFIATEYNSSLSLLFLIGFFSLILCIINFSLGKFIGGSDYRLEAGQALGQKNNGFTIWVALTFISPLAMLGPISYILFQNLYVSWQLHQDSKQKQPVPL